MKRYGRMPRVKDIKQAQELIKSGMTYRQTAWTVLKREDAKTIQRWMKYDVKKLEKSYPQGA